MVLVEAAHDKQPNLHLCFLYSCLKSGPEVIKLVSCSTQLSMKIFLLIIVKMPTVVGNLTFMSRKNSILGLSEPEKKLNLLMYLNL